MYGKDRDGIGRAVAVTKDGVIKVSGSLSEATLDKRIFSVANQTVVATTAALTTTWTGLGVSNPVGSGKNVIIHEFAWTLKKRPDGESTLGLMTSVTTDFADSLTAKSGFAGYDSTSVVYCAAGATIATPILERIYQSFGESENWIHSPVGLVNINGSIVLPPGRSVMTYTSKGFSECQFHFVWEEAHV